MPRNITISTDRGSRRSGHVARTSAARTLATCKKALEWKKELPAAEGLLTSLVGNAWDIVMEGVGPAAGTHCGKPSDAERVVLALRRGAVICGGISHRDGVFSVELPGWTYLVRKNPDGFGARPEGSGRWAGGADCDAFAARMIEFDSMLPELLAMIPGMLRDLEDFRLESDRKKLTRMITLTTAEQLVRKHLLPLGISADCYVKEDGTTVHVQLRKVFTGSLVVPVESLAGVLKDEDRVQGALSLEMPRGEEEAGNGIYFL